MGLSTSHDCWSGGYGGFGEFRALVTRASGLPYHQGKYNEVVDYDWESVTEKQIMGTWGKHKPVVQAGIYAPPIHDPVLYLLVHSDCEGKLRKNYLPALKARLEEIEPRYDELATTTQDEKSLRRFIEGLEQAIEDGEHVEFH